MTLPTGPYLSSEVGDHIITETPAVTPGPGWPDVDEYKDWARIRDTTDDVAIDQALSAVQQAILARCPVLATATCPPDALYATLLWTNRLLSRRNSPDGIVGVADLGVATISKADRDVLQLLSPWLEPVLS
jgi:hypothetical protein